MPLHLRTQNYSQKTKFRVPKAMEVSVSIHYHFLLVLSAQCERLSATSLLQKLKCPQWLVSGKKENFLVVVHLAAFMKLAIGILELFVQ